MSSPSSPTVPYRLAWICASCGAELDEGEAYCDCGAGFDEPVPCAAYTEGD